jgi:hypothetical protein
LTWSGLTHIDFTILFDKKLLISFYNLVTIEISSHANVIIFNQNFCKESLVSSTFHCSCQLHSMEHKWNERYAYIRKKKSIKIIQVLTPKLNWNSLNNATHGGIGRKTTLYSTKNKKRLYVVNVRVIILFITPFEVNRGKGIRHAFWKINLSDAVRCISF